MLPCVWMTNKKGLKRIKFFRIGRGPIQLFQLMELDIFLMCLQLCNSAFQGHLITPTSKLICESFTWASIPQPVPFSLLLTVHLNTCWEKVKFLPFYHGIENKVLETYL